MQYNRVIFRWITTTVTESQWNPEVFSTMVPRVLLGTLIPYLNRLPTYVKVACKIKIFKGRFFIKYEFYAKIFLNFPDRLVGIPEIERPTRRYAYAPLTLYTGRYVFIVNFIVLCIKVLFKIFIVWIFYLFIYKKPWIFFWTQIYIYIYIGTHACRKPIVKIIILPAHFCDKLKMCIINELHPANGNRSLKSQWHFKYLFGTFSFFMNRRYLLNLAPGKHSTLIILHRIICRRYDGENIFIDRYRSYFIIYGIYPLQYNVMARS